MDNTPLISVVDDDDSVRESLSGLIRSVGFRVMVFASAEGFLSSNRVSDTNCLILDVRMPGMNGASTSVGCQSYVNPCYLHHRSWRRGGAGASS